MGASKLLRCYSFSVYADLSPQANDNSGYIGAAIVGSFIIIVAGWYGGRWVARKYHRRSERVVLH